ncbi:MAG: pyruvate dehydrogenase (acetyl-transferring) E1 component subunit alpha [Candidatus Micrarchaeota archaeon]|nr:pyruvate dehydrogenase (acetyl-transferring) E1 component subunit alpha [Candidatus Micrarchaeota archaeon]
MLKQVFSDNVNYIQILDENGVIDESLRPKEIDDKELVEMYKKMFLARQYDAKQLSLQRQGRAVTYAPLIGEEATQIGSAMAMRPNDMFVPAFRQHGVYITRGMPLETLFIYWRGYEEGDAVPKDVRGYSNIVPVSTQMPHAVGIAYAQKYKKNDVAVISYIGDGGTSEGDFYEALNFAGVFKVPLVSIIENNQWAISVPREKQSAAPTLAQKAIAAGIRGVQVDGNDVLAVYEATREAIENAKNGPTVIECITYRLSIHTTADDPTKYRTDSEVEAWKQRDPLLRVKKYLMAKQLWGEDLEQKAASENAKLLDEAVEKAEQFKPDPKTMFTNVYSYMPRVLQDELDAAEDNNYWQGE